MRNATIGSGLIALLGSGALHWNGSLAAGGSATAGANFSYSGTTVDLGPVTTAPYTYEWVQPDPGIYSITAVLDDGGMSLTSAPVQVYAGPDGFLVPCPTPPPSG